MNPHLLNAAPFNSDEEENKNIREENNKRLSSSLNKTIKNRNNIDSNDNKNRERNKRIQKLLNDNNMNNMNNTLTNNESDDLEDFNPPSHPAIQEPKKIVKENFTFDNMESELLHNSDQEEESQKQHQNDNPVNKENFQQLPANNLQQYYEKYNAYLNSENNYNKQYISASNEELLKKIDHILFLLEEQRETRTNYVTEELILYVFLGIFVIYLVDSFVKVGKYIR
jgi:hypothetical protein